MVMRRIPIHFKSQFKLYKADLEEDNDLHYEMSDAFLTRRENSLSLLLLLSTISFKVVPEKKNSVGDRTIMLFYTPNMI